MKNILFGLSIFLLLSCENLLIKDLELEDVGFEKQLVVQCTLESNTDSVIVFVSENTSVLEEIENVVYIKDADVRLFHEGAEIAELEMGTDNRYYHFFDGPKAIGDYELVVSDTKYGEAHATTRIPEDAIISELKFKADAGLDPLDMTPVSEISFFLHDPPGKNYYAFELFSDSVFQDTFIFGMDTSLYDSQVYLYPTMSLDPNIVTTGNSELVFIDDEGFDGKKYLVRLRYSVYYSRVENGGDLQEVEDLLKLRFEVHSEDSFKYVTSLDRYYASQGFALFSEPVTVHTNIENGLGIFAGINRKFYRF